MPYGLISTHEEMRLFFKIVEFYSKLYPKIKFSKEEKIVSYKEIGEVFYTYAGGEVEGLAADKMVEIEAALPEYSTPVILLKKRKKFILLDGHRRLRVAWKRGMQWKALIIVPNKEMRFGVEDTITERIREMY